MKKTFISILLAFVTAAMASAQEARTLSGKIVDSNGEPLMGAAIVVKGTQTGFITDVDGNYTIEGVKFPASFVVSFVGYNDLEITLTGKEKSPYLIEMADGNMIDEIVVVGFGTQKKSSLSGAVGVVDGKTLNQRPVVSAVNALQGADPSLNITTSSGGPNASASINIRGTLSVNGGSALVLIDGVEGDLSMVNPNDIESVSILKDASSCAIYGAKASAGVVLVTTKQGKIGKSHINYNYRHSWIQPTTSTDFITNGYDHVSLINYFQANSFHGSRKYEYDYTEANGELLKLYERRNDVTENPERPWVEVGEDGNYHYYGNFDWFNYFCNTNRPTNEHNISINGGNENIKYFVSGRYYYESGLLSGKAHDDFNSYSIRSKIDAKVTNWLRFSNNINYSKKNYAWSGNKDMAATFENMWRYGSPAFSPYNPDGTLVGEPYELRNSAVTYLMDKMPAKTLYDGNHNSKDTGNLTMTNRIDIIPIKPLTISLTYDYRRIDDFNAYRTNQYYYSTGPGNLTMMQGTTSSYEEDRDWRQVHIVTGTVQYENNWGKHYFKGIAGAQYEDSHTSDLNVHAAPILTETYDSFALLDGSSDASGNPVASTQLDAAANEYATLGFFARLNYDYAGKYIFEASARYDGTSRFSPDHRWGFFPSASAAWKFSEENFFTNIRNVVSDGKIRLSAGSLGNQQVSSYYYIQKISIDNTQGYTFDANTKSRYASISDPVSSSLTWETVNTYDAGLDLSFFDKRLTLTGDYYIRDTKDMLTASVQLPEVYGATSPKENCADLRTYGWEVSIGWHDSFSIAGKPATYGITGFLGDRRTFITKYYNPTGTLDSYYEGMELGTIWGYRSGGLFASDEDAAEYTAAVNCREVQPGYYVAGGGVCGVQGARAGDFKILDVNGDGVLNNGANTLDDHGDLEIIGNSQAHLNYSFRLDFNWNGFDISAFFQGIGQKDWFPKGSYGGHAFWGPYSNTSVSFIHKSFMDNVWSETNTDAYFPRARGYSSYTGSSYNYWTGLGKTNDYFLQNIGYLRFKNLTVGYTLPQKWTRTIFLEKVRFYFAGENLCYFSPLKKHCLVIDPELAAASGTNTSNTGVGYLYPRTLSLGIDVTF